MATIDKQCGAWRARVRRNGISRTKTFTRKSDAADWALETERSIALGLPQGDDSVTLLSILQRYAQEITPLKKSAPQESIRIRRLFKSGVAAVRISDLRPSHIAQFRDQRLKQVSSSTCRLDLCLISHALDTARKEWGYHIDNPVSDIRKPSLPKGRDRRLEGDEEQRLLDACIRSTNHRLFPLVCFAIETGMRRGEMLSLEWKDVHLNQGWVHLSDTKNGSPRDVPLSPKAQAILTDLPHDLSGRVFPVHFEALKGLWRRATRRAGIEGLHFHDLRHEATSRFFEKGLNVMEVATITGHKDLRMLQRYTHLRAEDLAVKLG
ncbi:MAG: integrase [Rhodospirillaceae bacterium]|nr:integrase [Rhodospirillaceae bacterium]